MIGGRVYRINTDFRAWAAFQTAAAAGEQLTAADVYRWAFGDPRRDPAVRWPTDSTEALEGIGRYLRRSDMPAETQAGAADRPPAFDFAADADILLADFQREYGLDLTSAELSWWRFMALLEGLYCYGFADRVRFRVADIGRLPQKERREAMRKRSLFAIHRGPKAETFKEHMARLAALAAQGAAEKGSERK